ncbi:MAG: hypothetical protein V7695_20830 [Sulfitobacter sp.]
MFEHIGWIVEAKIKEGRREEFAAIVSEIVAETRKDGPVIVALNPGSLLASKMVKEGFGIAGNDLRIGAEIIHKAALSDKFSGASGKYFDNDIGAFGMLHADAQDAGTCQSVITAIEAALAKLKN